MQVACNKDITMAKIKIYLDTRFGSDKGVFPLKLVIRHNNSSAMVSLGVYIPLEEWDMTNEVVKGGKNKRQYNNLINRKRLEYEDRIIELARSGRLRSMSAKDIRDCDTESNIKKPIDYLPIIMEGRKATTKQNHINAVRAFSKFCDFPNMEFADITNDVVKGYYTYLSNKGLNVSSITAYFAIIRLIFSTARKEYPNLHNPFSDLVLKKRVVQKRNLTIEQVREVINKPLTKTTAYCRDMFVLSLFLIGMNNVDLYNIVEVRNGRIDYVRSKLEHRGKMLSIKVEPEAMEIIQRHKGKDRMLNISEKYSTLNSFNMVSGKYLKCLFPFLSSYWARHTWASIASFLGVPIDIIALALGHTHALTTTMIYINFDNSKIDEANRRVIDYILYDRK